MKTLHDAIFSPWMPLDPVSVLLRRKFRGGGGSSGAYYTLTGTLPLTLPHSLAAAIRSLVRTGAMTQSPAPTPDAPVYPSINNGTVQTEELPSGYKRLKGISFDGRFHYETGEYLTGDDDVTMTLDNLSPSGQNVFGSYNGANNKNFSLYIYGSTNGSYFRYGDQLKRPVYGGTGRRTITFGKNGTEGFSVDSTVNPDAFRTPANAYIGMLPNSSSPAYTGDIIGSILVGTDLEWIPCESDGGVIGYYERATGNFIAPTGSGTPVSLGYDTSHIVPRVVGTPEVLTVGGANLFNPATVPDEFAYVNKSTGRTISDENFRYSDFIPIKGGVAYYFGILPFSASSAGLAWYSEADEETYISGISGTALDTHGMVETAPEDARYVRFSIRVADDPDWDTTNYFCVNGALDAYQPYTAPQTATVPDLFAVGDYADEVDLVAGTVTRNVGRKVLDGTETGWTQATTSTGVLRFYLPFDGAAVPTGARAQVASTHFAYAADGQDLGIAFLSSQTRVYFIPNDQTMTVATWKAFLADQYAAGTPVIVWYPLATPTTESIAPQALRTQDGTTVVSSSAGSVGASVEYKASEEPSAANAPAAEPTNAPTEEGV